MRAPFPKSGKRLLQPQILFTAARFRHHVAVRTFASQKEREPLQQHRQAVVIRVVPPGGVVFLVLLLVQANGDDGVLPRRQQGEQFLVELPAKSILTQRFERRTRVEHLLAMENDRVVGMRVKEFALMASICG